MVQPIIPAVLKTQSRNGDLLANAVREDAQRTVSDRS